MVCSLLRKCCSLLVLEIWRHCSQSHVDELPRIHFHNFLKLLNMFLMMLIVLYNVLPSLKKKPMEVFHKILIYFLFESLGFIIYRNCGWNMIFELQNCTN